MEIEVQSPYGTKVGAGPIITGRNWRSSPRMNKIGAFSFEMPLNDPRRFYLVQKRYVRCYGMVDGTRTELGKPGIIDSVVKEIDANGIPTGMLRVSGRDLLAELADITIHELSLIDADLRIPDVIKYYDGTATAYIDMTDTYDDNPATSVDIPADDEDWHYIGDADPWDVTTWDFGAKLNSDTNNFIVQYSTGVENAFSAGTILSDTTKVDNASFAQDGSIRWERQEDWAPQTHDGVDNMYWLRFRYREDMSGDVTIKETTITQDTPTTTALADWLAYTDAAAGTPIADLGWDFWATHQATENTVFLILRDVSAFEALTLIAEQTGENFRLGTGRLIDWLQNDKTASDIRATNLSDGIVAEGNEDICLVTNLRETEDSYEVVGRVYPQGGGRGSTRVTLLECTRDVPGADYAGYTLSKSANYLKKDSVEAAVPTGYGRRIEITKFWPNVASPRQGNSRDVNSSNALFDLTYEYLSRHWEPQKSYIFSVVKLDAAVEVGETIQLVYWQTVEGTAVWNLGITAALHLWVLEMTHAVDDAGSRVVGMQVATIDAWPSSDAGKVKSVVSHIKALQSTDGPMGAGSLTASSVAELLGSLDLSAYYKKPTNSNVILGLDAGNVPPGDNDGVIIGKEAGLALTSGPNNVLIGYGAGYLLTTGRDNVAIGWEAMNDSGAAVSYCVAIGTRALEDVGVTSDGVGNTAVGVEAGKDMDTGEYNVAMGYAALHGPVTGDGNTAVGAQAMDDGTGAASGGSYNTALGYLAMLSGPGTGDYNIAIGMEAGGFLGGGAGASNIAIGYRAMWFNEESSNNIVIGHQAGYGARTTTYDDCVIIGYQAGFALETGDNNVLIGHQAGLALTGAANVFIGYLAGSQAVGVSNQLFIDNTNTATPLIYGEFDNDLVKIHGDLCLGTEDGLGRLNFTEGTAIADGIVWGSDANKVTLYRSADDMLKTDDSLTVLLGFNVGTATGATIAGQVNATNATIETTASFLGFAGVWTKTAGATDENDIFYGSASLSIMDDADSTIGHMAGVVGEARLIAGTVGADGSDRYLIGVQGVADVDGGTIWGDVFGGRFRVDLEAAMTALNGNVYGIHIWVDADQDPTGSVYMIYLEEATGVDYGIYQSGTAANVLNNLNVGTTGAVTGQGFFKSATFPVGYFERTTAVLNTSVGIMRLVHTTSGNMADGFGTGLNFTIQDDGAVLNTIAYIHAIRDGADNSGKIELIPYAAGAEGPKVTIDKTGTLSGTGFTATTTGTTQALRVQGGAGGGWRYSLYYDAGISSWKLRTDDSDGGGTDADIYRVPDGQTTIDANTTWDANVFDWICTKCDWRSADKPDNTVCPQCGGFVEWQDDAALMHQITRHRPQQLSTDLLGRMERIGVLNTYGTLHKPPEEREIFMSMTRAHWFSWSGIAQNGWRIRRADAEREAIRVRLDSIERRA